MERHIEFVFKTNVDIRVSRLSSHGKQQLYAYTPISRHLKVWQLGQ